MARPPRPQKNEFEDIVEPRRREGDIRWVLHSLRHPLYRFAPPPLTPAQYKAATLASPRVESELRRMAVTSGKSLDGLKREAQLIMEEMGHALSLRSVRGLGFFITKVMKRLYRGVYVNYNGITRLREAVKDYPIILLPSHRSYADFLLMSLICFDYDIPLPVIAAAMDFASMSFFGNLLRRCGAFFIRRSFASDQLYWLIFSEFVRIHLRSGQHPLEFYAEGTRSRTGKSLMPKTGMLGAILESWFLGEVPDVYLVPVSISHDRILEESLYAYELLGIPKPKESTSGLLKARGILSDNYGNVHFYIHEPMSLRQLAEGRIDRSGHNLQPRFTSGLLPKELAFLKDVAVKVVKKQQSRFVISPWTLMSVLLEHSPAGRSLKSMIEGMEFFLDILRTLGAHVDWPSALPTDSIVREQLKVHHHLCTLTSDNCVVPVKPDGDVLVQASQSLQLASYRNQLMHYIVREAILSCVLLALRNSGRTHCQLDELRRQYEALCFLLHREFVLDMSTLKESFSSAVANLRKLGSLSANVLTDEIDLDASLSPVVRFLARTLMPFLYGYREVAAFLSDKAAMASESVAEKGLAKSVQSYVFQLAEKGQVHFFDALSLDLIGNALAVMRPKTQSESAESAENGVLSSMKNSLDFIYSYVRDKAVSPSAKL